MFTAAETATTISIGIAILRYRLYDIDIIVNRTLVYSTLTATLVALYFGGVATMQALFRAFTGQEQQPQVAVVVSTLAIAALFGADLGREGDDAARARLTVATSRGDLRESAAALAAARVGLLRRLSGRW